MLIGLFRRIGLLAEVWSSHHREFCEKIRNWVIYFNGCISYVDHQALCASSCEQGDSTSLSLGCRKITPLSIVQMTCLSGDIVTIFLLRNATNAVLFSLILRNSPHFLEQIIGLDSATDSSFPWLTVMMDMVDSHERNNH